MKFIPTYFNKVTPLYDTDSISPTEQTAQMYRKVDELINDFNNFVEEVNTAITKIDNDTDSDIKEFKCTITQMIERYIELIDMKISEQDSRIESLNLSISYNETNEEVDIGG